MDNHNSVIAAYPRLLRRVQAVLIDGLIIPVTAITVLVIVSQLGFGSGYAAFAAALSIFILEPLLVAGTGGTLGHHLLGLEVRNSRSHKRIGIIAATFRFVMKSLLGLFSLMVILTSKRHQAIHDFLSRSVVIIKEPREVPAHEALGERLVEEEGFVYPSKVRRILFIVVYNIAGFILLSIVFTSLVSEHCLNSNICNLKDEFVTNVGQVLWLAGIATILVMGWKGRLIGCRRKPLDGGDTA